MLGIVLLLCLAATTAAANVSPAMRSPAADTGASYTRLMEEGRFPEAVALARRSLSRTEAHRPSDPTRTADALDRLLDALYRDGRWHTESYAALAERVVMLRERAQGDTSVATAAAWQRLGDVRAEAGSYEHAVSLYRRALAVRELRFGVRSLEAAQSRVGLSVVRRDTGHGAEAESLLAVSLAAWLEHFPVQSDDALRTARDLVQGIWQAGDYAQSRYYFESTLRIWDRVQRRRDFRLLILLGSIPELFESDKNVVLPDELLQRTLELVDDLVGESHPDVVLVHQGFAALLQISGDLRAARRVFERGLERAHRLLRPSHPDAILATWNLGGALLANGDFAGSRRRLDEAVALAEREFGEEHPFTALAVEHLGSLLINAGDALAARRTMERVLRIRMSKLGEHHPDVASSLSNLADQDQADGRLREARARQLRALEIQQRAIGPESYQVIGTLGNLARVDVALGQLDSARRELEWKRALVHKLPRLRLLDLASVEQELARIDLKQGDTAAARRGFNEAERMLRTLLGPDHGYLAYIHQNLAALDLMGGDPVASLEHALESERIIRESLRNALESLSEREALRFTQSRPEGLGLALSAASAVRGSGARERRAAMDALIRSRAVVLDEIAHRSRSASQHGDSLLGALRRAYQAARQRAANLAVRGPGAFSGARHRALREQAQREREERERALAARDTEFRIARASERIGLRDVSAALPPRTAMVSYVRYRRSSAADSAPTTTHRERWEFAAFVLTAGDSVPRFVRLPEASRIALLVQRWRDRVSTRPQPRAEAAFAAQERIAGDSLRAAIWDPVERELEGTERVYIVPDGVLHLVNFNALPTQGDRFVVDEDRALHTLMTERDLIAPVGSPPGGPQGLLAVGGVDYDRADGSPADRAPAAVVTRSDPPDARAVVLAATGRGDRRRGLRSTRQLRSMAAFEPLPQSIEEVREVAGAWRRVVEDDDTGVRRDASSAVAPRVAEVLVGRAASEAAFKRLMRGREAVHIATHGFFVSDVDGHSDGPGAAGAEGWRTVGEENPLVLCGLALAGANRFWRAPPEQEDGILTGEEIAALDLTGVRWVVLSACGTGTGRLVSGEGVFGLHRAFKIAGARGVIMSLWPVEDAATRRWMRALYEERLVRGRSAADAVREASRAILGELRAARASTRAMWWGSFVSVGGDP